MSRRIIRASLAVRVTDALTGKPVSNLRVRLNGCAAGQSKPDGYWVFTDLAPACYTAVIDAPRYQCRTVPLTVGEDFLLCHIPLVPGRNFPFPGRVLWIDGTPPRKGAAEVAVEEEPAAFRMVASTPAGSEQITLYDAGTPFPVCRIWVRNGDRAGALFRLCPGEKERGEYRLDRPLPWPVDQRTPIFRALPVQGFTGLQLPVSPNCRALHWLDGGGNLLVSQMITGGV